MKVNVNITVDIDPVIWDRNYGTGTEAKFVREDVKSYLYQLVAVELRELGLGDTR